MLNIKNKTLKLFLSQVIQLSQDQLDLPQFFLIYGLFETVKNWTYTLLLYCTIHKFTFETLNALWIAYKLWNETTNNLN